MRSAVRVESLLASSVTDTQTLGQEAIAGADVTPSISTAESRISTLDQTLIGEETSSAIFIRQVWPDHIVEHVVLHSG